MALQKQVETASGVAAEYWRISGFRVARLFTLSKVDIEVSCFISKTVRDALKEPVTSLTFSFTTQDGAARFPDALYTLLKTEPFFEGAQDV